MHRTIIALFAGIFIGGLSVGSYRLNVARNQFKVGVATGQVIAQTKIMNDIHEKLGSDYSQSDGYCPLYEVKSDAVVLVDRKGVKTLRVYAPRQK